MIPKHPYQLVSITRKGQVYTLSTDMGLFADAAFRTATTTPSTQYALLVHFAEDGSSAIRAEFIREPVEQ